MLLVFFFCLKPRVTCHVRCIETYMYDKWGCMVYDSGCWEEGQNARAMLSDLQSKTEEEV